jgi:hypothetical protein
MVETIALGTMALGATTFGAMATKMIVDLFKKEEVVKKYSVEDITFFCKNANLLRKLEENKEDIIYPNIVEIRENERTIEVEFDDEFFILKQFQDRKEEFQNYFKEAKIIEFGYNQNRNIVVTMFKNSMKERYNFEYTLCDDTDCILGMNQYENKHIVSIRRNALLAGSVGMGKSSTLHGILLNRLWNNINNPKCVGTDLVLIDLKGVELVFYEGYKGVERVATTSEQAKETLMYVKEEMERRNKIFKENSVTDIEEFNEKSKQKMRYKYIVIDEIASIQELPKKEKEELEKLLVLISSRARNTGQIMLISTQRPDSKNLDSFVKAQVSSTIISLKVNNKYTSETVIGREGAENLIRPGHAIVIDQTGETITQMPYLSSKELKVRLQKDIKRAKKQD